MNPNTDTQALQDTIEKQQSQIEKLQHQLKLRDGALSLLSHDIRGVGNNLQWVLDSLQNQEVPPATLLSMLPELKKEVLINQSAIENVLQWIAHTKEYRTLHIEDFSLSDLYDELTERINLQMKLKDLQISFRGNQLLRVQTDRYLLSFILIRILDNAIKYSYRGGLIRFEATATDDHAVTLTINDEGVGVADQNELFTFDGTRYTGTSGEKGAGFSLVVVREMAKLLGISIAVSSEPKNTKFVLKIPNLPV